MRHLLVAVTSALAITLLSCGQTVETAQPQGSERLGLQGLFYKDDIPIIKVKQNIIKYKSKSGLGMQATAPGSSISPDVARVIETDQSVVLEFGNGEQVAYNNFEGYAVSGGDTILDYSDQMAELASDYQQYLDDNGYSSGEIAPMSSIGRRGFICTFRLIWCWTGFNNTPAWPNGELIYQFGFNVTDSERAIIRSSAGRWNATGAYPKLLERSGGTAIYMAPNNNSFCGLSPVGYKQISAIPVMLITRNSNCLTDSIILHEFGHAAGLNHEHQRCDRDRYLSLSYNWWDFINYNKLCNWGEDIENFDFDSIMMYHTSNIAPRSPLPASGWTSSPGAWYNRSTLSAGDRSGLFTLYGK